METEDKMVEAIEEGRIVKVSESYARREGLLILKKAPIQTQKQLPPSYLTTEKKERFSRTLPITEYVRAKPDWREKQVISELIDNFHWQIRFQRRRLGLTRKQVARMADIREEELQLIESGRLPSKDFVLINKIQKTLGINLRKDGKEFDISTQQLMQGANQKETRNFKAKNLPDKRKVEDYGEMTGKDIDIIDDEN